jgi:hypothetical protein
MCSERLGFRHGKVIGAYLQEVYGRSLIPKVSIKHTQTRIYTENAGGARMVSVLHPTNRAKDVASFQTDDRPLERDEDEPTPAPALDEPQPQLETGQVPRFDKAAGNKRPAAINRALKQLHRLMSFSYSLMDMRSETDASEQAQGAAPTLRTVHQLFASITCLGKDGEFLPFLHKPSLTGLCTTAVIQMWIASMADQPMAWANAALEACDESGHRAALTAALERVLISRTAAKEKDGCLSREEEQTFKMLLKLMLAEQAMESGPKNAITVGNDKVRRGAAVQKEFRAVLKSGAWRIAEYPRPDEITQLISATALTASATAASALAAAAGGGASERSTRGSVAVETIRKKIQWRYFSAIAKALPASLFFVCVCESARGCA